VELYGAKIRQDDDTSRELYGRTITFKEILSGRTRTPEAARMFVNEVEKDFTEARAGT